MDTKDDAAMQAECVVRALDMYLAMMPWPAPTSGGTNHATIGDRENARKLLIDTFARDVILAKPERREVGCATAET